MVLVVVLGGVVVVEVVVVVVVVVVSVVFVVGSGFSCGYSGWGGSGYGSGRRLEYENEM